MRSLFIFLSFLLVVNRLDSQEYSKQLEACATVKSCGGQGSGFAVIRGNNQFFWTAAHVVACEQKIIRVYNLKKMKKETLIVYNDIELMREIFQDGRKVGYEIGYAKVIRFSSPMQRGHDLALLRVYKKDFFKTGFTFESKDYISVVGDKVSHIGSRSGVIGSNMLSEGLISNIGKLRNITKDDDLNENSRILDLFTCTSVKHGCSGGVVFRNDNKKAIGVVVQILDGTTQNVGYFVPVRRMYEFAKDNDCLWALDETVPVPSIFDVVTDGNIEENYETEEK